MCEIESGRIRLLFRISSHDGIASGIGFIDGSVPVYLEAEELGGFTKKEKWKLLEGLLDELLDQDDAENIWDRIERKYNDEMWFNRDRIFRVYEINDFRDYQNLLEIETQFNLHSGIHKRFEYDKNGICLYVTKGFWNLSIEYQKAHIPDSGYTEFCKTFIGEISHNDLMNKPLNSKKYNFPYRVHDPRSPELIEYQKSWKSGDPVSLDWEPVR